jgi:DNA ligase 1
MADLADGESCEMKGSAAKPYVIKNTGGVYSCSCPAWRNQSVAIESRTCKHIRKLHGDAAETERVGNALPAQAKAHATSGKPPLLLAHAWDNAADLSDWWISEKLDGVRAYWTGKQFLSRDGNPYHAPDWFVEKLPDIPLDGELWIDRGKFQQTVSVVRRQDKSDHWKTVRYVVFDAPAQQDPFEERMTFLKDVLSSLTCQHTTLLDQERCTGEQHLRKKLAEIEALGGEGLMLRQPASLYEVGRSSTLLKVKTFFDAEAVVIDHTAGKGKHKGRLGALVVQLEDGTEFNVGTGFSDAQRDSPPAIGSVITFRYQELTDGGVPRFPSFLRVAGGGKATSAKAKTSKPVSPVKPTAKHEQPKIARKTVCAVTMAYYEFSDGKSEKFWEIGRDGCDVTVRYGRIGTTGQIQVKTFASEEAAQKQQDKLIEQKTAKGYLSATKRD